jgi:hypothetical protein
MLIWMKRNRMPSWMDSTTRFSSNFSILTMRISRRWSTRLSLSKKRSKRWRRMERGKYHSRDCLREATPGLACFSQNLSSETRAWFVHQCMDNIVHSRCSDWTFRHSNQTSKCRSLSHRLIDPMCSNHLARTYSKAVTQLLQPRRMHQLGEAIMVEPVSSAGWLVTLHGRAY